MTTPTTTPPWHAAYPAPSNPDPPSITAAELLERMQQGQQPGKDFVLVDLRRNDHEGGTIRGSINLPAQSLYPTIPTLYELFAQAGVKEIIFYCTSSRGRGPRGAGWFVDHLTQRGNSQMKSLVLQNGIKGWVASGEEYTKCMDEYEKTVWST
ncbi:MAG: hypothetical protein M1823_005896 [Watsoniomyces obsoletus]|nr:MAG: hypothetical protein M1823_005896 [Watsoniomyces obsoletus]